ncbi:MULTISPECIES: response regulator transcription factor [unclassified Paenibacillus]|uniref:response regulator transcription factor n=1 Tax=unclassified Paenibacillus TaxID=185978 RepID=UPI002406201B|nr:MULTISPECIES: response regulator transcription factor [unclassified Paenibacillus]MDF9840686.1 OmpR family two-component system bacitracin resistance response regulator BceR [Paenibacillus sp. PastF-2]MDF9847269.1 OmpR family two-component system bacitracin resistance response regulator BceR [Paenibacillus sp. PastM-2]MDF9853840.1 OmpR family two-component system bacitracin resistance response regulator BceR [Paenibacillus sp. PastF-1]MDH6478674.1 OmpR family two-component system bacitracin 
MEFNIFVVEDDQALFEALQTGLEAWAFRVTKPDNFNEVMRSFLDQQPHLVIMDITLPKFDGFHWCREIRSVSQVPIIFLSSRDHPLDMVMALNMGADDFVQKPFHTNVLYAKIQAILRRTYAYGETQADTLEWNGALIDLKRGVIRKSFEEADLTKNEFFLLLALVKFNNSVISRHDLIRKLWEDEQFVNDNTLTANITRLRQKLEPLGLSDAIVTKKGMGYMAVTL